ncbi:hypothetical protein FOZ61_009549 [Perkinsus olseni]|uniref:Uncharacterized protein n=1 Tax=Perkinsus olseni TaxID=32597 RepID=A0A7J6M6A4_PEROL|nr:hypothetical protein FOZ61_009549 [Perkinsus olseni]
MTISVEDLRHRFTEFQIDGCVDIGAFHELVRSCHLGEATLNDGLITTLFKLLDVSRRGVINWAEFERLPSLLMSIALKPSHPGDPLPPSGTVEIPPVAVPMSSSVRPVKLTLPAVEEGQLDKGSTWAKLGLDIEDDIHLASSSIGRSRKKSQPRLLKSAERSGKYEDSLTGPNDAITPEVSQKAVDGGSPPPVASRQSRRPSPSSSSPFARVASVEECVASWLNGGEPPLL